MMSPEMCELIFEIGQDIYRTLPDGYVIESVVRENRTVTFIQTGDDDARKDNMEHNTLLMALGGGNGN